jgi:hypothetical protein
MVRIKEVTKQEIAAALTEGARMRTICPLNSVGRCIPPGRAGDRAWVVFAEHTRHGQNDMPLFLLFLAEMVKRP